MTDRHSHGLPGTRRPRRDRARARALAPSACARARRCASSISKATRRSTSCSTTPHDDAERYSAQDTIAAQGNIFLRHRHGAAVERRPADDDDRRRPLSAITTPSAAPARARATRCATATTPSASTPASTTSCDANAAHGLGKRDMVSNINLFMNVPVEADGALGIVDGISAPGLLRRPARRDGRARASSPTARRSTIPATASTRRPCA